MCPKYFESVIVRTFESKTVCQGENVLTKTTSMPNIFKIICKEESQCEGINKKCYCENT